jgi:hypothetical protein
MPDFALLGGQIGGMSDRRILFHWRDSFCCVLVAYDRQQSTMGQQKPGFSWWRMTRGARHRRGPGPTGAGPAWLTRDALLASAPFMQSPCNA